MEEERCEALGILDPHHITGRTRHSGRLRLLLEVLKHAGIRSGFRGQPHRLLVLLGLRTESSHAFSATSVWLCRWLVGIVLVSRLRSIVDRLLVRLEDGAVVQGLIIDLHVRELTFQSFLLVNSLADIPVVILIFAFDSGWLGRLAHAV